MRGGFEAKVDMPIFLVRSGQEVDERKRISSNIFLIITNFFLKMRPTSSCLIRARYSSYAATR